MRLPWPGWALVEKLDPSMVLTVEKPAVAEQGLTVRAAVEQD
jgi:hypothetical protein